MLKTNKMKIREEFRRDGLAANFLADPEMMKLAADTFPGCMLSIGYPAVCTEEKLRVKEILQKLNNPMYNMAVYCHARKDHLDEVGKLIEEHNNASVCFWIPISEKFINNTLKKEVDDVIHEAISLVNYFKSKFRNRIDVALADTTLDEDGLPERVAKTTKLLHEAGVSSVIICDTRGIATVECIENMFKKIRQESSGEVEFHPHVDNGVENTFKLIDKVVDYNVTTINTALFRSSERGSLISPEDLLDHGYAFEHDKDNLEKLKNEYRNKIGTPLEIIEAVYGKNIIATGSQYRLRDRFDDATLIFGVTSDKFILAKMLDVPLEEITDNFLDSTKGQLYKNRKIFYTKEELNEFFK
jgi:hypothetical protein